MVGGAITGADGNLEGVAIPLHPQLDGGTRQAAAPELAVEVGDVVQHFVIEGVQDIAALQAGAIGGLALTGLMSGLGRWYWGGLGVAALLAAHQQWLIRDRDPDRCFRAFLGNNLFGLAVFAGILLHYLFAG